MSNTNPTETNSLNFYDYYAKRTYWRIEEAVALSLNIDPRKIKLTNGRLENDQGDRYNQNFCTKYDELMELVKEGVLHNIISSNMYPAHIVKNIHAGYWPEVDSLGVINWCKDKDISFPEGLETLVKKYNKPLSDEIDLEAKCKELEVSSTEIKKLVKTKPLHGSEKLVYQKIISMQALISSGKQQFTYEALIGLLPEILEDAESLRNKGDNKLPFELPCDKTIASKYKEAISKLFSRQKCLLTQKEKILKK